MKEDDCDCEPLVTTAHVHSWVWVVGRPAWNEAMQVCATCDAPKSRPLDHEGHMNEPKTKREAEALAKTMDERKAIALDWANDYRRRGKKKVAEKMSALARQFAADAETLRALLHTLPE